MSGEGDAEDGVVAVVDVVVLAVEVGRSATAAVVLKGDEAASFVAALAALPAPEGLRMILRTADAETFSCPPLLGFGSVPNGAIVSSTP
jgi:hypothetical protein